VNQTLRERILGAWQLASFTIRNADTGDISHPLGTAPRGMILYTDDGHMSAQLADADMGGYIAYGAGSASTRTRPWCTTTSPSR